MYTIIKTKNTELYNYSVNTSKINNGKNKKKKENTHINNL